MAAALVRHAGIDSGQEEVFQKIVERLTTALAQGHICIELDTLEREVITASTVAGENTHAPLVLSGNTLYFGRYYRYEVELAETMSAMAAVTQDFNQTGATGELTIPCTDSDPYQDHAVTIALHRNLCVISGGPGTGKTTLIVKIIRLLLQRYGPELRIGLAAPTGKAAMRMNESIRTQIDQLDLPDSSAIGFPDEAVTLHRLLGMTRFTSVSRYHGDNPMPYDVVVVDEASMVDLAMMWRLVKGLKPGTRLILIGDKDQLASVESGAVLADCIDSLGENVAELKTTYRFNTSIASLAEDIKNGNGKAVWSQVLEPETRDVTLADRNWLNDIGDRYEDYIRAVNKGRDPDDYPHLFSLFGEHMVLCALRNGLFGVKEINRRVELLLSENGLISPEGNWYPGKPVMISTNDHSLSLFNGDIGLCLPDPDADGELRVWFYRGGGRLQKYPPGRIPASETAWAMTIHKAQGSEFGHVTVVLPEHDNQILCRELLYTAVTRARQKLTMVMNEEICSISVGRKTVRHSGLAERLTQK